MSSANTANLHYGQFHSVASLETCSDFQIVGTGVKTMRDSAVTNYSGYNAKYIGEQGAYNPMSAAEEFAKRSIERRYYKEEQAALMMRHTITDSHEAFILNMLISWFKACIYSTAGGSDDIVKIQSSGYKDAHVEMPHFRNKGSYQVTIELGFPKDEEELTNEVNRLEMRNKENYFAKPYVFYHSASSKGQSEFYYSHLAGRTRQSELNVDINLPGVDCSQVLLDCVGGAQFVASDYDAIPWDKPETIWEWIVDYTRLNRVEHALAASLETLGSIAAMPMSSTQEGTVWNNAKLTVHVSFFSPTRARFRNVLEGDAYVESSQAHDFIIAESPSPRNFMVYSAIMNYAMWMGIYVAVDDYARTLQDWRNAFVSLNDATRVLMSPVGRAAMCSVPFGKEVPTTMNDSCWLAIELGHMAEVDTVKAYKVLEPDYPPVRRLKGVTPYVSGALLIGSCVDTFEHTAHLAAAQNIKVGYDFITEQKDAVQLANAYRLFGHEVTFQDLASRQAIKPYCNVRECVISPSAIFNTAIPDSPLKLLDSREREGRSYPLPHVLTLENSTLSLSLSAPSIGAAEYRRASKAVRSAVRLRRPKREMVFRVAASHSVAFSPQFAVKQANKQDFRREESSHAPGLTSEGARPPENIPESEPVPAVTVE